jgi:formylglycine-generating enzyme required for sulfatase activity
MKYTDYEGLKTKAEYQSRLEKAWYAVDGIARMEELPLESRLSGLTQFLQEFQEDNRHRGEAENLADQLRRDAKKKELEQQKQLELSRAGVAYQSKLEQSWTSVQGTGQQASGDSKNRLLALNRFLRDFPEDNPHRAEAEKLVEQIQREAKPKDLREPKQPEIARAPAYDARKEPDSKLPREITGRDGAPMVLIPSGEFVMGSSAASDERPAHRVHLDSYYIDALEVTNSRYAKFLETVTTQQTPHQWNTVTLTEDGDRPVIGVNWSDADAYCRWAEKRLPTEAEWEKAARGTDGRKYPWGDEEPREEMANFSQCCGWSGFGLLAAVGTHQAGKSPYGVFDLAGNVWEWVADWYEPHYYKTSPDRNPTGPATGRDKVMRGGSWSNRASDLRASIRDKVAPTYRNYSIGFRCASSVRR